MVPGRAPDRPVASAFGPAPVGYGRLPRISVPANPRGALACPEPIAPAVRRRARPFPVATLVVALDRRRRRRHARLLRAVPREGPGDRPHDPDDGRARRGASVAAARRHLPAHRPAGLRGRCRPPRARRKIENSPDARPQAGLHGRRDRARSPSRAASRGSSCSIQCSDGARSDRCGAAGRPTRRCLAQLGRPILAYSGGAPTSSTRGRPVGLVAIVNYIIAAARPSRVTTLATRPTTSTRHGAALYSRLARPRVPDPLFAYADDLALASGRSRRVHLPFSAAYADVWWSGTVRAAWLRAHGDVPHLSSRRTSGLGRQRA